VNKLFDLQYIKNNKFQKTFQQTQKGLLEYLDEMVSDIYIPLELEV